MSTEHVIVIKNGRAQAVYSDALKPTMVKMGGVSIARASHVEPGTAYGYQSDRWVADMTPSGGPILVGDGDGYATRDEALAAEREWLRKERGL